MPRRRSSPVRRPTPEMRRASPAPAPAPSHVPAAAPPAQVAAPAAPASQGPGLMGQMAATAGGVAIGNVVGHGLTSAIFGSGSSSSSEPAQQAPPPPAPQSYGAPPPPQMQTYDAGYSHPPSSSSNNVCGAELEQFLQCAQDSADITFCQGLNEALKQCKMSYGQYTG